MKKKMVEDRKEKRKKYQKEYREKNKDKWKIYHAGYKDKRKEYRIKNRERLREYKKNYIKINIDKIKERRKRYYQRRKEQDMNFLEKNRIKARNYHSKNRDKIKFKNQKKRDETLRTWEGIISIENNCQICGEKIYFNRRNQAHAIHFDHKNETPNLKRSPTQWLLTHERTPENERLWKSFDFGLLCRKCNSKLPTKNRKEFMLNIIKYMKLENEIITILADRNSNDEKKL